MAGVGIFSMHETTLRTADASGGDARAAGGAGQGNFGRLGWDEDRGAVTHPGRAAPGVDYRGPGPHADESDPLDSWRQRRRVAGAGSQAPAWAPEPPDPGRSAGPGGAAGRASGSLRPASGAVGWADPGRASPAAVWDSPASAAGPRVASPIGLPAETRQPHLSAGPRPRRRALSTGAKKNSGGWGPARPSCSKMRPASPCTRAWAGAGPAAGSGCGSSPPASIGSDSISRGGWRPCWVGTAW